ncbi:hypothetical protein GAYE_SCF46G5818 [Galdieria yellowstonensis]|uniref:Pyridine nucleotide-disulfide oxidoreductase domain-containing protein 2 n=1 Tax=Galdieria yellowstonensis TaxID=3028027 RepID=A0AAV9IKG7_9RHOD|nr:hypothetical protein GAYE_SCF46G5818 [Galdieria yellowstonensis]
MNILGKACRTVLKERLQSAFRRSASQTPIEKSEWDAIIVGGGHNGLVAAAYLAKKRAKVLVLERRKVLGGAAVTEELIAGFHFSRASYVQSLLRPEIVKELKLAKHGYSVIARNPSSFTPLSDGKSYLFLSPDVEFCKEQIAKFSNEDATKYPQYLQWLSKLCRLVEPFFDEAPYDALYDDISRLTLAEKWSSYRAGFHLLRESVSSRREMTEFFELLFSNSAKTLKSWFHSEPLLSTLATDSIIGTMAGPDTPGTGYVLLHHVLGGDWSYVRGGMGSLSQSLASVAVEAGAVIQTDTVVKSILVDEIQGKVKGVETMDGRSIFSRCVLSNADPKRTFLTLCPKGSLPEQFLSKIRNLDFRSPVFKINVALNKLPHFRCFPKRQTFEGEPTTLAAGPEHKGTIHLGSDNLNMIEKAYKDCSAHHRPSAVPIVEMTIPSAVDPTLAPRGQAVAGLFVQYVPYDAPWEDNNFKKAFVDRVFSLVEDYAPGFIESVIGYDALSPKDLERVFGLTEGNIFHGALSLDQLYSLRPVAGYSRYRTPIPGLYICGSGAHPGGGVSGAPGRNCSKVVLRDLKRNAEGLSLQRAFSLWKR